MCSRGPRHLYFTSVSHLCQSPHGSQLQAAGPFSLEALLWTNQVVLITWRLDYVSLWNSFDCVPCAALWCWFVVALTVFFLNIVMHFGVSHTAAVVKHLSNDMPGCLHDHLGCTLEHSPQERHNFHSSLLLTPCLNTRKVCVHRSQGKKKKKNNTF